LNGRAGHSHSIINEPSKLLIRMALAAVPQILPSFLPSICQAPALARDSGRFGESRPFEIYRQLSTLATIADTIDRRPRRS
jgi:hypothetical protein